MKLATVKNATADGSLIVVSVDGTRFLPSKKFQTMQQVIESWDQASEDLNSIADQLTSGAGDSTEGLDYASPLPRAWQWLDGSVFASHGALMQKAFHLDPIESDKPLMYQGMSHVFYGPNDDIPFVSEADGIDFEGEVWGHCRRCSYGSYS
jgi:fumarylacetoacetate (FAA) hydrolase